MALSASILADMIISELQNQGFETDNPHAKTAQMCKAIANAVVAHITSDATVTVSSGSSAGVYQVE